MSYSGHNISSRLEARFCHACSLSFCYGCNPGANIRLSIRVLLRVASTGAPPGEQAEMDRMLGKGAGSLSLSLLPTRSVRLRPAVLSPGFPISPQLRTDTFIPPTSPHRSRKRALRSPWPGGETPFLVPHTPPPPFRVLRMALAGTVEKIIGQFRPSTAAGCQNASPRTPASPQKGCRIKRNAHCRITVRSLYHTQQAAPQVDNYFRPSLLLLEHALSACIPLPFVMPNFRLSILPISSRLSFSPRTFPHLSVQHLHIRPSEMPSRTLILSLAAHAQSQHYSILPLTHPFALVRLCLRGEGARPMDAGMTRWRAIGVSDTRVLRAFDRPACLSTQRRRCPLLGGSMLFGPESDGDGSVVGDGTMSALSCIREGCSWRMQLHRRTPYDADGCPSVRALHHYSRFFTLAAVPIYI
ncbi:hypothetical protein B0H13DRAFT_2690059 [Mycena leptocephala]|nr:hypothetical protein B0H13DRAFT_2690059 [Mycena leptocephala]